MTDLEIKWFPFQLHIHNRVMYLLKTCSYLDIRSQSEYNLGPLSARQRNAIELRL